MALSPGTRLGPYEIVAPLGAGGMGEVYRARDMKLDRDVAIKIVPSALAADPAALARFELEARAVATISHPNILAIFDAGTERGTPYIVTELLEGTTLREALADGALPARRAIDIAVQAAAGLAAAHARGITHRDLKPENLFITRDGRIKVLDFGLAKRAAPVEAGTIAATYTPTSPGTVLGTVGYMSPEQVRGLAVDHRADIFSLGAVLFEMLTGTRAFARESAVETMNAILKEDPREPAPGVLSPALERVVRRCLEKDPAQRFESVRDLGFALEAVSTAGSSAMVAAAPRPVRRWAQAALAAAVLAVTAVTGVVAGRATAPAPERAMVTFESKTFDPMTIFNARFAPDGETIVFSAAAEGSQPELYVSRPGGAAPQRLGVTGTHLLSVSSTGELAVLTDATFIGHRLFRGTLARMRMDGAPRPWLEQVREADWSPDGSTLAVVRDTGVGDELEYPVGTRLHQTRGYLSDVRVSPDGSRVAFFEHPEKFDDRGWLKVVNRSGEVTTLTGEYWGCEGIAWTADGSTIVYAAGERGWDSFYPRLVNVDGTPAPTFAVSGIGMFVLDVARNGNWLVTRNDDVRSLRALLPGDSSEREFPWLGSVSAGETGGLSADGRLLLFTDESESAGPTYAASVRRTDGTLPIRLGPGAGVAVSPDGTRVLAHLVSPAVPVIYPVGAGEPRRLPLGDLTESYARGWFPDGRRVIVCGQSPSRPFRCYQQDVASGALTPMTPDNYDVGPLSPDATRIVLFDGQRASTSLFDLRTGQVRPLPALTSADRAVAWSGDGRALFVQSGSPVARLDRIDVDTARRTTVREVTPPDRAALLRVLIVSVLNDGRNYSYTYWKRTSRLLLVRGAGTGEAR